MTPSKSVCETTVSCAELNREMHDFETQHSFQHPVDMMSQNWEFFGDAVATTNFARFELQSPTTLCPIILALVTLDDYVDGDC